MALKISYSLILTLLCSISLIYALYKIHYIKWDLGAEDIYLGNMNTYYQNKKLQGLDNMNNTENLPLVLFTGDNEQIPLARQCATGFVATNPYSEDEDCVKLCLDGNARLVIVDQDNELYHNGIKLASGAYCTLTKTPQCNPQTSITHVTLTGVSCVSRFPRIFGGENGGVVVACNSNKHYNDQNILWDYANDKPVNSQTVITDEDEMYGDDYRFRCKFGLDENRNPYVPNLSNRFIPERNPCRQEIVSAHPNVLLNVTDNDWSCDCGDVGETRVSLVDPNDPKSGCTGCPKEKSTDARLTVSIANTPYNEFKFPIAPSEKFTDESTMCHILSLDFRSKPEWDTYELESYTV